VIEDKDVEHVARLARLHLSEEERARMRAQLGAILRYVDQLKELPVEGVEPTAHAVPLVNVMREDEVQPSFDREAMMANAPDRVGEFFRVPRIIED
jgi:aspartyl-tRNA(Asn)/glutamyl-tRNA(Gln) amidotransferase subunit C